MLSSPAGCCCRDVFLEGGVGLVLYRYCKEIQKLHVMDMCVASGSVLDCRS